MKFKPTYPVPRGPVLTDAEKAALRDVSHHLVVHPLVLKRLKAIGLIEQKLGGWVLTQDGQIRLMFSGAR
jgi:ribosomal protein S19E (S16A)